MKFTEAGMEYGYIKTNRIAHAIYEVYDVLLKVIKLLLFILNSTNKLASCGKKGNKIVYCTKILDMRTFTHDG